MIQRDSGFLVVDVRSYPSIVLLGVVSDSLSADIDWKKVKF